MAAPTSAAARGKSAAPRCRTTPQRAASPPSDGDALAKALPDKGAGVTALAEADAALYSCLLLSAQQEVERSRQAADDRVAAAESRVRVAEQRVEDAENSKASALAAVAEPLALKAQLDASLAAAEALREQLGHEKGRATRLERELASERSARRASEALLAGDGAALASLPLARLEAWVATLRRACDVGSDALVGARVAAQRAEETAAAEAELRAKEAAGVPLATDCPVCLDRPMDTALDCGHRACGSCAALLADCHVCRAPVRLRLRLY